MSLLSVRIINYKPENQKIFKIIIRPVMQENVKANRFLMRILRNQIQSIYSKLNVLSKSQMLRWLGHLQRVNMLRSGKRVFVENLGGKKTMR